MNSRRKYIVVLLLVLFVGAFSVPGSDRYLEIAKNIDIFTRVFKEISFNYVDEINVSEFLRAGIRGMLGTLDPYTVFIDEKRQDEIDLLTTGKYGGIGVSIGLRDNKITILEIMDGYSAQKQGINVGDIIYQVGDKVLAPDDYENISSYVKGEPGTFVKLRILRTGVNDTLYFELLREEITIKNITFAAFYPAESNNAYIKLSGFSRSAGDELKKVLIELQREKKIESIVFDLRSNPGGLLDAAVEVSNTFLKKGQLIVSTRGRDSSSLKEYFAVQEPLMPDVPVIVLVNEGSASASEIVAGAIQDHDRGVIVGEKTFGKGLVQTISPLSYNTSLKITTSKYYTPSGRCIQKIDYSSKNKVLAGGLTEKDTIYNTDNKRIVYSAGGIAPDSSVSNAKKVEIVSDLLAKGMFFKFANQYSAKNNSGASKPALPDMNNVYKEFKEFINKSDYRFESDFYKKLGVFIKENEMNQVYSDNVSKMKSIREEIKKSDQSNLDFYTDEIKHELKMELVSRISNTKGRIMESLEKDNQFLSALGLLKNSQAYNKLLNKIN
ncbi:MAG: PDZ domain-containing protein [Ignavibacteriaceae bacterium]|nr:PDZ domain-containing protein [Ignavibacteriaceae bacterium]